MVRLACWTILLIGTMATAMLQPNTSSESAPLPLEKLLKLQGDGNYREAYDGLREYVLRPSRQPADLPRAFLAAVACLNQLNRTEEVDAFRDEAVAAHRDDWRLLAAAAQSYQNGPHYGYTIGGEFHRGQHRGGGRRVHATARDRVNAIRLFRTAMQLASTAQDKSESTSMLRQFAETLLSGQAWRLQLLTNLDTLPDYEVGWGDGGQPQGAPVDEDGIPVFYSLPTSWDNAKNDGERWRWTLETMVEWKPNLRNDERMARAQFLESQFGVQTLVQFGVFLPQPVVKTSGAADGADKPSEKSGVWTLDTLGEDETIARLATGVKRFKLPDEQNYIKLLQQVAEERGNNSAPARDVDALSNLAQAFENRRQYPRAAAYWQTAVERSSGDQRQSFQKRLEQIKGNWGQFETVAGQPAGRGATVEFRFRNAHRVDFVAHKIKVAELLADVKAYLKSKPKQLDWERMNIGDIGYLLVQENGQKYIGADAGNWNLDLEPNDKHFDNRITVTTPLQNAGAYLVTAKVAGGNTSKIILWLADTAIARKPLEGKSLYFVADSVTGSPIAKANVEFFAFRQRHLDGNNFQVDTKNFAEATDDNGQAFLPTTEEERKAGAGEYQWLATATTPAGRLAYLGFHNVWTGPYRAAEYNAVKAFTITDRPVYRPGQAVQFKFWVAQAQFDVEDKSAFAHQAFAVEIHNPKGDRVYNETLTSDGYGGIAGQFELPSDAILGQYRISIVNRGGGTFRVEEYKKPEYEVTVEAPNDPVMLGEKVTATIRARYYFGSPVANATVMYKVLRSVHTSRWYPPLPWDWLYGPGYGWLGYDYAWYPGWRDWGCGRPLPPWFWRQPAPPEVVAERELPIGTDGTVKVEFDSSLAKELHGDQDHRYEIQAEVVDQSRRTIVGNGHVLVARKPFEVFSWVDRGHYRVGDTITARVAARRLDGKPVEGAGKLRLLKITYGAAPDRTPTEAEVRSWALATNPEGTAEIQLKASEKGQFRLSYGLTDKAGHAVEGGYIFTISGEGFDGGEFQFNDLEIVPDKQEYAPHEKVQLQVNTNRIGSTVLLFLRPANGIYLPPQVVRLTGKSTVIEVGVTPTDMPNFFVEALTIADGRLHTETREIHVPPVKRVLNLQVVPSAESYKPGQHAKITLKLTDAEGKPFVGSTVLSVFDKSLEYISGGTNVADIKEFFWKWQRHHRPYSESNLGRYFGNLVPPGDEAMAPLGVFGDLILQSTEGVPHRWSYSGETDDLFFGGGVGRGGIALGKELATVPSSPARAKAAGVPAESAAAGRSDAEPVSPPADLAQPALRSEFADTALWLATLETNKDGIAEAELDMPQNLTAWKIRAWGIGHGTRVGEGSAEAVTRKNIIVRMQAPRFLVERDEVVLSANVHNYLPTVKSVKIRLELDGNTLELPSVAEHNVEISAGGEKRVDWRVKAVREGQAVLRMLALTDVESDAVQMTIPVQVHGMLKMDSFTGSLRSEDRLGSFEVRVPQERRVEHSRLEVRYSPTLAGAMVDALPYLVDYPYGCTEQTLNRFLPAVITQRTLQEMKLDLNAIQQKRANLNAQEIGDADERAKGWKRYDRNPVFDKNELGKIVKAGVNQIQEMQLSDGGWGWFSGWGEYSSAHTTATVVHGLQIARQNDVALIPGVLERGIEWLKNFQEEQLRHLANVDDKGRTIDRSKPAKHAADNLDALVYMVLADAEIKSNAMCDRLYRDRTRLSAYGLATYGVALRKQREQEKLAMVLRNLRQYLVQDDENQTAYLKLPSDIWWYWYGSEIEAEAFYLKLLAATEPNGNIAPRLVKYLLNNRKHSTYWNSTRDTALVIEALADYLRASGEDTPNLTVEVWVDGQKRKEEKISKDNLFTYDGAFVLAGDALTPGPHTIELRKSGTGPLYWNGYLTNFTLEDRIRRAGLELKVERHYYKLTPVRKTIDVAGSRGQTASQRVEKFERTEVADLGRVKSGDLLEIELLIESKNDYEYLLFEDMKAAGCEPMAVQSGYNGNELGAYVELRDNRVSLFVRSLARGQHSVSYRMRAETLGRFSALPTKVSAMYAPELRGNSDELKLNVEDQQPADASGR